MICYRNGGCGPYENRSCGECPASKPEYVKRYKLESSGKSIVDLLPPLDPSVIQKLQGSHSKIDLYFEPFELFQYEDVVAPFEGVYANESDFVIAVDAPD